MSSARKEVANLQGLWADGPQSSWNGKTVHLYYIPPNLLKRNCLVFLCNEINFTIFLPYAGDYHLNINVQQTYWAAGAVSLSEVYNPVLRFVEDLSNRGHKVALFVERTSYPMLSSPKICLCLGTDTTVYTIVMYNDSNIRLGSCYQT